MRSGVIVRALLGAVTVVAIAPSLVQAAGVGGRPANPDPKNERTSSIFVYTLDKKRSQKDAIVINNQTEKTQKITLGSVDGVTTNTGAYTCRQASEPVKDSGKWVHLSKTALTLAAGKTQQVPFTVKVPAQADVGEHNSCITIQADDSTLDEKSGIRLHMRQAVRVSVTVPGALKRELVIDNFSATKTKNGQRFELVVANNGNVSTDTKLAVTMRSITGKEIASLSGEYPIMPNQTLRENFSSQYRPLFGDIVTVSPSATYNKKIGVTGVSNKSSQTLLVQGPQERLVILPTVLGWLLIAAVLSLIIVAVVMILLQRLQRRRAIKRSVKHVVESGDTITGLAKTYGVSWKKIARFNNLKAPYTLKQEQVLAIPQTTKQRRQGS